MPPWLQAALNTDLFAAVRLPKTGRQRYGFYPRERQPGASARIDINAY